MFCKECGKEIPDESNHCPECGVKLINTPNKDNTDDEGFLSKKRNKGLVGCCIGLFIIFLIIAIASNGNHDSYDTSDYMDKNNDVNISEEDFKNNCTELEFNKVNKNPDKFIGEKFKCTGKIIQIMEDDHGGMMRLALGEYYSDVVYVVYDGNNDFVEDDYVTVYGYCDGSYSYTSTIGASVTLPKITAKYIED